MKRYWNFCPIQHDSKKINIFSFMGFYLILDSIRIVVSVGKGNIGEPHLFRVMKKGDNSVALGNRGFYDSWNDFLDHSRWRGLMKSFLIVFCFLYRLLR